MEPEDQEPRDPRDAIRKKPRLRTPMERRQFYLVLEKSLTPDGYKVVGLTDAGLTYIADMAAVQCTRTEIAACLGISKDTLYVFEKENPGITEVIEHGHGIGRTKLRKWQEKAASKGQSGMLTWLGKQWLGQTDKAEIKTTTTHSLDSIDFDKLTPEKAAQLSQLIREAAGIEPEYSVAPEDTIPPDRRSDHYKMLKNKKK